jgi:hypothetical protein
MHQRSYALNALMSLPHSRLYANEHLLHLIAIYCLLMFELACAHTFLQWYSRSRFMQQQYHEAFLPNSKLRRMHNYIRPICVFQLSTTAEADNPCANTGRYCSCAKIQRASSTNTSLNTVPRGCSSETRHVSANVSSPMNNEVVFAA